ncbi:hypothetical protein VTJ49DRAFT_6738 [Mycothermus thermophilus]|uniref:Uncharacterized protein n=1 Tax=Humicola insolens TaxID=85995 RepID=A0ABR3V123_HUMIN
MEVIDGVEIPVTAMPGLQLQVQRVEYAPRTNESSFPTSFEKTAEMAPRCEPGPPDSEGW